MNSPLYGLVLAGGKSERMGRDKGLLQYHDKPHRFWMCDLLAQFCERAFISVNQAQDRAESPGGIDHDHYDYIVDDAKFAGNGPIGALISTNEVQPGKAWFVVSCDLPFFTEPCARLLLDQRDSTMLATAFLNPEMDQPEPLATIYEVEFMRMLPEAFRTGENSMRRLMNRHRDRVKLIEQYDPRCVQSADKPDEYEKAKREINLNTPSRR